MSKRRKAPPKAAVNAVSSRTIVEVADAGPPGLELSPQTAFARAFSGTAAAVQLARV
jgi:hypothetical protein